MELIGEATHLCSIQTLLLNYYNHLIMNNIRYTFIIYLSILSAVTVKAQTTSIKAATPNQMLLVQTTPPRDNPPPVGEPIEEARKRFMALFNLYRDYSVTIDTATMLNSGNKNIIVAKTPSNDVQFGNYLDKMNNILSKRLEKITAKTPEAQAQRSRLIGGLTILQSAKCLNMKDPVMEFVETKDMEGNEFMAFELEGLRQSSRYGMVENYKEGYARIRKDQVFGFLNLCGEEVITSQYERAEPFNNGRALVKRVDWFFVNPDGTESEPLDNVVDGKALAQGIYWIKLPNNKQALMDNNYDVSKVSISQLYDAVDSFYRKDVFRVRNGKKMGLIGVNGKTIMDAIYDNIEPTNLAGIYKVRQNGVFGLLDTTWTVKISPRLDAISDFNAYGLATAKTTKGSIVISSKTFKTSKSYEAISEFNEYGVATIRNEAHLYGLIDTFLNVIVEPKYMSVGTFNELGLASACYLGSKCGFIKYDGTEQIKATYESVGNFNSFGLAVATTTVENCGSSKDNKCHVDIVLDHNGNTIVPVYDESIKEKLHYVLSDSLYDDRYIIMNVFANNSLEISSYMLIDKNTLQLLNATPYQSIAPMDIHGNIRVEKNDKWGIIDSTGKVLAKPIYKDIRRTNDSYYATQNDKGKWGFLNKKGRPQIPFEYEEVRNYRHNFAPVSKGNNKWGLISPFNAKIVPCAFKSVNLNLAETKFEIMDLDNILYIINDKGDCETNCPKFEEVRAKANKQ